VLAVHDGIAVWAALGEEQDADACLVKIVSDTLDARII
jgi:hypothetical protein